MQKLRDQVKLEALSLEVDDETREIDCPKCVANGDVEKGSFTVKRTAPGLLYNCYRTKCGFHGFIPSLGYELRTHSRETDFTPKVFHRPLRSLPKRIRAWLRETYRLTDEEIRYNEIKYDYSENRLWQPITSIEGLILGSTAKKLPREFATPDCDIERYLTGQKSIAYWEADVPRLDFPIDSPSCREKRRGGICVVEDKLSAIRVNQFMRCCSLSGSHIDDNQAGALSQLCDTMVLALDFDTWFKKGDQAKGVKLYQKYGLFFRKFEVRMIQVDPKEMSDDEILEEIVRP